MDTNFNDTTDMENSYKATETKKMDVDKELQSMTIDKDSWKRTQKLLKLSIDMGMEEALAKGFYDSSVVKDAIALMRLAEKSFDEDNAAQVLEKLNQFNTRDKNSLAAHKKTASGAAAVN